MFVRRIPTPCSFLELQAVPDGDVGDQAAFGRHNGRGPAQDRVGHRRARAGRRAARGQGGQAFWVTDAGHVCGQMVWGEGRQEPVEAGADHVGADQQVQADPQVARHRHRRPVSLASRLQAVQEWPPPVGVAQCVSTADLPAFLPCPARLIDEPVDHRNQPAPPPQPCRRVGKRQLRHPGQERVAVLAGGTPRRGECPRRIPAMQPLHIRPGHRRGTGCNHRLDLGPVGSPHEDCLLNNVVRDSARYPPPAQPLPTAGAFGGIDAAASRR